VQADGLARALVEILAEETDSEIPDNCRRCARLLERLIEQQPSLFEAPHKLDSCSWVGSRLAEILPLPLHQKQELLELADARARLERLNALLTSSSLK
jgi:Lon protease-like protein